jgi:hypothetical protein
VNRSRSKPTPPGGPRAPLARRRGTATTHAPEPNGGSAPSACQARASGRRKPSSTDPSAWKAYRKRSARLGAVGQAHGGERLKRFPLLAASLPKPFRRASSKHTGKAQQACRASQQWSGGSGQRAANLDPSRRSDRKAPPSSPASLPGPCTSPRPQRAFRVQAQGWRSPSPLAGRGRRGWGFRVIRCMRGGRP